ncbi:MAG: GNAT family N-acetyltransferase [Alphaproteobacteria bacterium]|nr:GNAT family N-acetyltransferase [Alphaproteobacteria bacterium]
MKEFKTVLKGEWIELRVLEPTFENAQMIFDVVKENREHLLPWLGWASKERTKSPEDSFLFLLENKKKREAGTKLDFAIFFKKEYLGNVGIFRLSEKDRSGEIGYWLKKSATGKGFMQEAVKLIENEFFSGDALNRIQLVIDEDNIGSSKVAQKCGYELDGIIREKSFSETRNQFENMMIYSKLKSEWEKEK